MQSKQYRLAKHVFLASSICNLIYPNRIPSTTLKLLMDNQDQEDISSFKSKIMYFLCKMDPRNLILENRYQSLNKIMRYVRSHKPVIYCFQMAHDSCVSAEIKPQINVDGINVHIAWCNLNFYIKIKINSKELYEKGNEISLCIDPYKYSEGTPFIRKFKIDINSRDKKEKLNIIGKSNFIALISWNATF